MSAVRLQQPAVDHARRESILGTHKSYAYGFSLLAPLVIRFRGRCGLCHDHKEDRHTADVLDCSRTLPSRASRDRLEKGPGRISS